MADQLPASPAEERAALAAELLGFGAQLNRIDEIKTRLKKLADLGGSFTEQVEGLGSVSVRCGKPGGFKGLMPTLAPELFLASDEAEKARLLEGGLVFMSEIYGRGSYTAVTVKLAPSLARP